MVALVLGQDMPIKKQPAPGGGSVSEDAGQSAVDPATASSSNSSTVAPISVTSTIPTPAPTSGGAKPKRSANFKSLRDLVHGSESAVAEDSGQLATASSSNSTTPAPAASDGAKPGKSSAIKLVRSGSVAAEDSGHPAADLPPASSSNITAPVSNSSAVPAPISGGANKPEKPAVKSVRYFAPGSGSVPIDGYGYGQAAVSSPVPASTPAPSAAASAYSVAPAQVTAAVQPVR